MNKMTWEDAVIQLRKEPHNSQLVKACFYDDPLFEACERYHKSTEWVAIQEFLRGKSGVALDVGAGRGIATYALAKDGWSVTALEPDPSFIVGAGAIREISSNNNLGVTVIEQWGESLPFETGDFDLVFCRQVLHHARDLRQFCGEIGRVLKPGGMLLGIRDHVISNNSELAKFLAKHPLHRFYGGENAFLLSDYVEMIEGAGFRIHKKLNSFASDINLYPSSTSQTKARWAKKMGLKNGNSIPDILLRLRGGFDRTPGRLYSFVAFKK